MASFKEVQDSYKREERARMLQAHPLMRLAADLASSIGQPGALVTFDSESIVVPYRFLTSNT